MKKPPRNLKERLEENVGNVLEEAGIGMHSTTIERIGDVVMATLKKHGVHDDGEDYTWWTCDLR
jgi:uncharacterized protein (UPF0218 family)